MALKHNATPWTYDLSYHRVNNNDVAEIRIYDLHKNEISGFTLVGGDRSKPSFIEALETIKSKAAFIVRAVNMHDELLAELDGLCRPDAGKWRLQPNEEPFDDDDYCDEIVLTMGDIKRIRTLISKAQGKE